MNSVDGGLAGRHPEARSNGGVEVGLFCQRGCRTFL